MNRREFLKTCAALGVAVSVPSVVYAKHKTDFMVGYPGGKIYFVPGDADTIAEAIDLTSRITFTDYYIDDRWLKESITVGPIRMRDGQGYAECSFDTALLWSAVELEDSEGRAWTTKDGERWECGNRWFNAEGLGGY